MDYQASFHLLFALLIHHQVQAAFIPEAPVQWLPSGHVFDSGAILNSWNKAMENYLKYSWARDDDKRSDQIGVNKKIPSLAENMNEIGLLRFGKRTNGR